MRTGKERRLSDIGGIDGGEGRGVRLGGSDPGAPPTGWARRRRTSDAFDDDETLIETPQSPFEDFDEFNGDNDATPDDRRRDPLRRSW